MGVFIFFLWNILGGNKMDNKLEEIVPNILYKYKGILIRRIGERYICTIDGGTFIFNELDLIIGIIEALV